MSWIIALKNFTGDHIRQAQFFMICRQMGIIFSSIIIARSLPLEAVGTFEMLVLSGYFMTFFWSDALLRGYMAKAGTPADDGTAASFLWLYFIFGLTAMGVLYLGQSVLLPLFVSRPALEGIEIFIIYQALVIPLWISPFIGILRGQNILLASFYVLIGPAFSCWTGFTSLPGMTGMLIGLFCYALVGFIWVISKSQLLYRLQMRSLLVVIWPATWPLALYAISTGLARSFDAWLVARYFDESSFAIFRYGAREFPLVMALAAGLGTMMIPKLFDNKSLEELRFRSSRVMHIAYPVVGVFILISPWLFVNFFGPHFKMSAYIFNIYLLLSLTQLIFPQSIFTSRHDTKILWYVSIAELIINIIASLLLMPTLGLAGIAWGTLIAFVFEKLVLLYLMYRKYGIIPSEIMDVKVWSIYSLILVILFICSAWLTGM